MLKLLEVLSFIAGFIAIWLSIRQNILSWPLSIIANVFLFTLFFEQGLLVDMSFRIIFIALALFGWHMWFSNRGKEKAMIVHKLGYKKTVVLILVSVISIAFIFKILPIIGYRGPLSIVVAGILTIIAQYLLAKKYIENWYILLVSDLFFIFLYISLGLYLLTFLYVLTFGMCLLGLRTWRKELNSSRQNNIKIIN